MRKLSAQAEPSEGDLGQIWLRSGHGTWLAQQGSMTFVRSTQAGLLVSAAVAIVGCGTSNTSTAGGFNGANGGSYDAGYDSTNGNSSGSIPNNGNYNGASSGGSSSGGNGSSNGGGTACPGSCSADTDCQNSCPAATNGGANCCDTMSSTCFMSQTSTCPAPGQTGSE